MPRPRFTDRTRVKTRVNLTMTDAVRMELFRLGNRNVSRGVEIALRRLQDGNDSKEGARKAASSRQA